MSQRTAEKINGYKNAVETLSKFYSLYLEKIAEKNSENDKITETLISFREYVKKWQDKGVGVVLWTINHPAEKDYFTTVLKCPIMTDCVKEMQSGPKNSL